MKVNEHAINFYFTIFIIIFPHYTIQIFLYNFLV